MEENNNNLNSTTRDIPDQPQMPPIPDINSIPPLPDFKENTVKAESNIVSDFNIQPEPTPPQASNNFIPGQNPINQSKGFDNSHLEYSKQQLENANKNLGFSEPVNKPQNTYQQQNPGYNTASGNYTQPNYNYNASAPIRLNIPNAGGILTLGILSVVSLCCCAGFVAPILSIIALAMFPKAKRLYAQNPQAYSLSSYNNLKAGQICAIIGLVLAVLFLIYLGIMIMIDGTGMNEVNQAINEAWNETGY